MRFRRPYKNQHYEKKQIGKKKILKPPTPLAQKQRHPTLFERDLCLFILKPTLLDRDLGSRSM